MPQSIGTITVRLGRVQIAQAAWERAREIGAGRLRAAWLASKGWRMGPVVSTIECRAASK